MNYVDEILSRKLTPEEENELHGLHGKDLDNAWNHIYKLTRDEFNLNMGIPVTENVIKEIIYLEFDLLLSGWCKLEQTKYLKRSVRVNTDSASFDLLLTSIKKYKKADNRDANLEALKCVEHNGSQITVPAYAGEYCFQALCNANIFPWGKRANASENEIYAYDNFNTQWSILSKKSIPDWWEFEKNTGFNFSLYLLYIASKIDEEHKCKNSYDLVHYYLLRIIQRSPMKIMSHVCFRCLILRDIIQDVQNQRSHLNVVPTNFDQSIELLESLLYIQNYDKYEEIFLKWVLLYVKRDNDTSELCAQRAQKFIYQYLSNLGIFDKGCFLENIPGIYNGVIKQPKDNRSRLNKKFVKIHSLSYKIVSIKA